VNLKICTYEARHFTFSRGGFPQSVPLAHERLLSLKYPHKASAFMDAVPTQVPTQNTASPPAATGKPASLLLFLCYRRSDGGDVARRLKQKLDGIVVSIEAKTYALEAFFRRRNGRRQRLA
jgi:hypothetical protein